MIYLYLKTHNVTGLKYLGKTTQDPYQYKGSGVRWENHIKKHSYDVSTTILFQTENKEEFKKVALDYSHRLNIVESKEFANLTHEEGQGGMTTNQWEKGNTPWNKGKKCPYLIENKKLYWEQWKKDNPNYKDKWKKYIPKGKENWNIAHNGKGNISVINKRKLKCPHCGKESNAGNIYRWHNDNCKQKK
jgi:hypothetical protein